MELISQFIALIPNYKIAKLDCQAVRETEEEQPLCTFTEQMNSASQTLGIGSAILISSRGRCSSRFIVREQNQIAVLETNSGSEYIRLERKVLSTFQQR